MQQADAKLLKSAADRMIERLREFQPLLSLQSKREIDDLPLIQGGWITLAKWRANPLLGISFDRCKGFEEPKYWVGLHSPSEEKLRLFTDGLPHNLGHRTELNDSDFVKQKGEWTLKRRPSKRNLQYPVFETYKKGFGSFFGIYDIGTKGKPHEFDIERAFAFLQAIVESATTTDFDENALGLEGSLAKIFVSHRRREIRLRSAKVHNALQENDGRLICEVENCRFDFKERYGDLGASFAHVHHKEQLSKAPTKGWKTSLEDLAIVCANCHAMIHRGGKCRPLDEVSAALIQNRDEPKKSTRSY